MRDYKKLNFSSYSTEEIKSFITKTPLDELKKIATSVREEKFGNKIQLCSIINAKSGACREDCAFCAQSIHHRANIERYPLLEPEKILKEALSASKTEISHFGIVTSGTTISDKELETICDTIKLIKRNISVNICASLGKLSAEKLKLLKQSGLKRYHHNLETSESYLPKICKTHTWNERVETVLLAQQVGLELCSGVLFGMGESWEDRINLARSLYELKIKDIPINFLTPIPGTPLEKQSPLTSEEALRIIILYRLFLSDSTIRSCGGRAKVFTREQLPEIYSAGANAIMTGNYLTTSGITPDIDKKTIVNAGLTIKLFPFKTFQNRL